MHVCLGGGAFLKSPSPCRCVCEGQYFANSPASSSQQWHLKHARVQARLALSPQGPTRANRCPTTNLLRMGRVRAKQATYISVSETQAACVNLWSYQKHTHTHTRCYAPSHTTPRMLHADTTVTAFKSSLPESKHNIQPDDI